MRKRRPMARALSLLLSLILALSLLPGAALAAETDNSRVYSPEEVDSVLGQAVRGGALTDENKAYDLNGDGKLTTWDAKKMLDALTPELARAIRFKAMRIANGSTDWVDVTIQDGKVSKTTVLNHFIGTLNELHDKRYPNYTFYPEAGALCGGKLMLQVAYYNNGTVAASDLVPVDPDSFAAPAMNAVDASDWHDITALSDGRMLTVSSVQQTLFSLWQDGKRMADGNLEKSALGGSVLVGIASAGKDNSGAEALYGLAKDGKLYRFSLTVNGEEALELTTPVQIGESNVIPKWYETESGDPNTPYYTWEIDSASLLATNGYLLAAVTYFSMALVKYQSKIFVIDPEKGSCVKVALDDGVVLNSLYQYEQEDAAGVQLYVETDAITLKAGTSVDLPAAEAYTFRTDKTTKLVTTSKLADAVEWTSSNPNVVSIDTETGKITAADVTEKTTATLTAVATANGQTVTKTVTVTVNPDTGMKVGAMIRTSGNDVWAEIKLDATAKIEGKTTFTDIDVKGTLEKGVTYTGVGYARGKLWGVRDYALYSFSFDSEKGYVGERFDKPKDNSNSVVDLTGAPAIAVKYNDGTQTVTEEPAPLVYVTYSGQIGLLGGTIKAGLDSGSIVSDSDYKLSAITYVGDLTAGQVRKGTNNPDLSNCSANTLCHVYYALTEDAELRQLILVPQVDMKDNTPTLSYTLRGSTIGTVTFTDNTSTTSMDFWTDGGSYGLLVARSNGFSGSNSIYYIDLTNYTSSTSGNALSATELGKLTNVNDSTVNSFSGLYHTENTKLSDTQIYKIAGWIGTSSQSLAEVTLEASLKAVSAEGSGNALRAIPVPVYASEATTNGLWTLTYDSDKFIGTAVGVNSNIHYFAYDSTTNAGTLTAGFASRTALSKGQLLFTVEFLTTDASIGANAITVEQVELNDPNGGSGGNTGDNTGGNTGGNSGTVTPSKPETLPFTDVEEGSYCYDAVRWAVEKGVTEGVSETSFAPNEPCTRGQAVTFLWRAAGSPAPESQEMPFTDVAESSPYAKAILWAAENGVTKGVTETTFAPNQPCTRGQIVTFLYRSQGAPAQAGSNPFTDVAEESPYLPGILWAAENGVTKGVTETTFAPNNTCVRGQIVTFLFRLWT